MKVKELIKLLQAEDLEREVILAEDDEGNGYSPLYSLWTGTYVPETTYSGEAYMEKLTEEDIEAGYTEEDISTDGQKALFLTPVN